MSQCSKFYSETVVVWYFHFSLFSLGRVTLSCEVAECLNSWKHGFSCIAHLVAPHCRFMGINSCIFLQNIYYFYREGGRVL